MSKKISYAFIDTIGRKKVKISKRKTHDEPSVEWSYTTRSGDIREDEETVRKELDPVMDQLKQFGKELEAKCADIS